MQAACVFHAVYSTLVVLATRLELTFVLSFRIKDMQQNCADLYSNPCPASVLRKLSLVGGSRTDWRFWRD